MRLIVKHTFLYVLLGFVSFIKAQDPVIQHMSKISNLPDVKFYDIIEDNDKNIWLSANKGLFKYNGKTYKKYTNTLQKVSTLFNLKLDNKGKLWCNNIYGQFFYVENDSLKLFFDAHELVKGQLSPFEIDDNAIKLYTTDGVYAIHLKDKKVTKLFKGMVISKSSFKDISHIIKVSTHKTSSKKHQKWYQIKNNKLKLLLDLSSKLSIQSPKVFTFKDGTILNFKEKSKNKFLFYNVKLEKVIPLQSPKNLTDLTIYNIIEHQKDYWFLTTSGVFVYQIKANQFVFKEQMFSSESITDFLVDFNNNYWFTTLDNGVFVSTNLKIRQVNLQNYKDKITAQCLIKNNQFILGTNTGKLLFYHKNKLIKTIQLHGVKIIGNLFLVKLRIALLLVLMQQNLIV